MPVCQNVEYNVLSEKLNREMSIINSAEILKDRRPRLADDK